MNTDDFRVRGGKTLKLSDIPTDTKNGHTEEELRARMPQLQLRLAGLQERLYAEGKQSLLVVLQARDAGGKDGTVKHVFMGVNPQGIIVTSFKVPSPLEQSHDFLWRVHAHAPAAGMIGVFNRSHYEEILVTRVHGLIDRKEAERRFEHIRAFESLLEGRKTRILKFYLHISKDEQRQRLQQRLDNPDKLWKFNPSDLDERALWSEYDDAYQDALSATSTDSAPWYVIPADHKWFRDDVMSHILLDTLEEMNPQYPKTEFDPATIRIR